MPGAAGGVSRLIARAEGLLVGRATPMTTWGRGRRGEEEEGGGGEGGGRRSFRHHKGF